MCHLPPPAARQTDERARGGALVCHQAHPGPRQRGPGYTGEHEDLSDNAQARARTLTLSSSPNDHRGSCRRPMIRHNSVTRKVIVTVHVIVIEAVIVDVNVNVNDTVTVIHPGDGSAGATSDRGSDHLHGGVHVHGHDHGADHDHVHEDGHVNDGRLTHRIVGMRRTCDESPDVRVASRSTPRHHHQPRRGARCRGHHQGHGAPEREPGAPELP